MWQSVTFTRRRDPQSRTLPPVFRIREVTGRRPETKRANVFKLPNYSTKPQPFGNLQHQFFVINHSTVVRTQPVIVLDSPLYCNNDTSALYYCNSVGDLGQKSHPNIYERLLMKVLVFIDQTFNRTPYTTLTQEPRKEGAAFLEEANSVLYNAWYS